MHSLPIFIRLKGRPVILIGNGDVAEAKRRMLLRAGAEVVGEEAQAVLAIVALDDDAEAEAAVARLRTRGILVNAVDRPALCDFTLPAIVDRDPVLIAIGTGGASAGLAAALRQRLEALLPASLGRLADTLFAARPVIKARYPDPRARRQAIGAALVEGGALNPFKAHEEDAVAAWLALDAADTPDHFAVVMLRSSHSDDLTLREARLLSQADCVCYTMDVPPEILARARADAHRVLVAAPPEACSHGACVFITKER